MKTVVTICGTCVAALAFAGLAAAATPQGHLTGSAKFNGSIFITPFAGGDAIHKITITSTISDGETVYVNTNNDPSGDCDGDVGAIEVQYNNGILARERATYTIDCAHFSGGNHMMVSYTDTALGEVCGCDAHVVFRVQGRPLGTDDVLSYGTETSATRALQWVNLGSDGSGHPPLTTQAYTFGDFTVTA